MAGWVVVTIIGSSIFAGYGIKGLIELEKRGQADAERIQNKKSEIKQDFLTSLVILLTNLGWCPQLVMNYILRNKPRLILDKEGITVENSYIPGDRYIQWEDIAKIEHTWTEEINRFPKNKYDHKMILILKNTSKATIDLEDIAGRDYKQLEHDVASFLRKKGYFLRAHKK
jgi:hypothetical protein